MPPTETSARRSFLVAIALAVLAGWSLGFPLLARKNGWGFLVLLAVPMVAMIVWGVWRRRGTVAVGESAWRSAGGRRSDRLLLAAVALLLAPVGSFVAGCLSIPLFDIVAQDQEKFVSSLTVLGGIAGAVVALALLVSSLFEDGAGRNHP
jgi:hypothetical protein